MPTVLITGLNGFVAVHTAIKFLSEGWEVRGTVRSRDKGEATLRLPHLASFAKEGRVGFVVVADLIEGNFTQALEGVDAVAHCASPWHYNGTSWAVYRDPAVKGTVNIMKQVAKTPSVKAVAIVSSFAAVFDPSKSFYEQDGRVYTEADWLPQTEEQVEALEDDGGHSRAIWYCASKKFAERAAMDLHASLGSTPSFSLAALNPPSILGPSYHVDTPEAASSKSGDLSLVKMYSSTIAGKDAKVPPSTLSAFVDVRDVANALYEAITRRANGRYLLCGGVYDLDLIACTVEKKRPDLAERGVVPQHELEGQTPSAKGTYRLDTTKASKELGMKFIDLDTMTLDTVAYFEKLGCLEASTGSP